MNSQTKERFGLAALLGIPIGIMSAFVKWGGEFPLPPRSPKDMFDAACGPEGLIRTADQIDCSRNFSKPAVCIFTRLFGYYRSHMPRFTSLPGMRLTTCILRIFCFRSFLQSLTALLRRDFQKSRFGKALRSVF